MRNAIAVAGSILLASCATEPPPIATSMSAEAICFYWYRDMPPRSLCYGPEKAVCMEVLTGFQDLYARICEDGDDPIFNPATYGREDNGS